ncbi:DUF3566 domain-containing protein [Blastococcus brunescens]|uniref:DUF3566 domain-containing protein n=1 Tax=Blastococcus brunescens TaxID=1564165 RepID=A0ABZ1AZ32_9ACTN|nr:DUF3566 domain-containing protein [Blastococcus sp. BMG 8361]WRL63821.1 DUF3566 domain-containing protein [Blastococcus sp. BMG 8361]
MSDRTQGSVRTESPAGDPGAAGAAASTGSSPQAAGGPAGSPDPARPVTGTQAIPTTGAQRAQGPATGSTPAGGPAGAPPVPPPTGSAAAARPETAAAKDAGAEASADAGAGRGARGRGPSRPGGRGPRRARLQLRHIDTWSALKISLVLSIAMFFIWMVAVGVLYGVLNALDVFDTLNDLFGQIGSASGTDTGGDVVTPGLIFGGAAIIGAINIVLMTALCTVGTFIYNLCSDLVGGLELTLSERD